ncbi:hypothetical protein NKH70_26120 [Mesorhizobium sp. M0991]
MEEDSALELVGRFSLVGAAVRVVIQAATRKGSSQCSRVIAVLIGSDMVGQRRIGVGLLEGVELPALDAQLGRSSISKIVSWSTRPSST